jgi:dipeptidyl aminopeptidase/acylaminoacyl peptidase
MRKIIFLFLFFTCGTLYAQMTVENLINVPFPTSLTSSNDGKFIAWVFNDQGVRNVWVSEAPEFSPRQITEFEHDDGQEISSLTFAPDGTSLIFVRGSAANTKGEIPNPTALQDKVDQAIWTIQRDGSGLAKLAPGFYPSLSPDGKILAYLKEGQVWTKPMDGKEEEKKMFKLRGTQTSLRWSPDGLKMAFVSRRSDHAFLGIFDLATTTVIFADPSVDHDVEPVWSPDGEQIAFIRLPNKRKSLPFSPQREGLPWSILIADAKTGSSTEVWKAPEGKGSVFQSLDAKNSLFWLDDHLIFPWEGNGWKHLYSVSTSGGEAKLLTPGDGEVESAYLSQDKTSLLYVSNIGDIDRRHLWKVSVNRNSPQQITEGEGIEWSPVETTAGTVSLGSGAINPAWPYLHTSDGQSEKLFADLFPSSFPTEDLVAPQAVMITATDGMEVPAQLFLPKDHQPGDKLPALIFTHGGPMRQMLLGYHYGLYYHHFYAMNQYFANQGYVVLSLNYRSGIGYGLEFREALDRGAAGASEYQDLEGAGLYLAGRDDVDPEKIALWGGSYGGYLTAMGLSKSPELFAAGVDIHGVHDWNEVIRNFVPSYQSEKRKDFAELAYESSPMNYLDNWKAPVLVIHGDDDRNVPFSETVSLVEELRERNVHVEQLIFPDEVHSFLLHSNWVKAFNASTDFLERQLNGKSVPLDLATD